MSKSVWRRIGPVLPIAVVALAAGGVCAMAARDQYRVNSTHAEGYFRGVPLAEKTLSLSMGRAEYTVNLVETAGLRKPQPLDEYYVFFHQAGDDLSKAKLEVCPSGGQFCYRADAATSPGLVARLKTRLTIGQNDEQRRARRAENTYKD